MFISLTMADAHNTPLRVRRDSVIGIMGEQDSNCGVILTNGQHVLVQEPAAAVEALITPTMVTNKDDVRAALSHARATD